MIRFLATIIVNFAIWIGLGKWGASELFPDLMASPFASSVPLVMLFGGVLTSAMIVSNLIIHGYGKE